MAAANTRHAAATSAEPAVADDIAIRPFRAEVPQAAPDDLRRRLAATRWPEPETVDDFSQGVQLEKLKPLVDYWGTAYDWRRAEAKLNAVPQFLTDIDGLTIHFAGTADRRGGGSPSARRSARTRR